MYRFYLDKSSKKFVCPSCGKRRFVRYMDKLTNNYTNAMFGRCDRESSFGYHKYHNSKENLYNGFNEIVEDFEPSYLDDNLIGEYGRDYGNNNFVKFLKLHFTVDQIKIAVKKYRIGTSHFWSGSTVFWQLDQYLNIRTGKIMLYNQFDGHRIKKPRAHIYWIHKKLKIENFNLKQCLFGLHNLCDFPNGSLVCIVESEKTAVIMSMLYPEYLWLATGGKSNMNSTLLQPLKNYKILLHPDKSEFIDWNKKAEALRKLEFDITCSKFLEQNCKIPGLDLADVLA